MKLKTGREVEYRSYVDLNSNDPYSARVVSYAEDWAVFMERLIAKGAKLEQIAEEASRSADTDGITGFMYGCAVEALATFWEHGDALRVWHNARFGVSESADDSVVNPAVVTVAAR